MSTTVHDVHVWHWQDVTIGAADVAVEWFVSRLSRSIECCEGNTEDGVCAELALVWSAVEIDHGLIESTLIGSIHADDGWSNHIVDCLDGVKNTLATVNRLIAIATFPSFCLTGGSTRWNEALALSTIVGVKNDLDGWVTAGIENLTCVHAFNDCHNNSF